MRPVMHLSLLLLMGIAHAGCSDEMIVGDGPVRHDRGPALKDGGPQDQGAIEQPTLDGPLDGAPPSDAALVDSPGVDWPTTPDGPVPDSGPFVSGWVSIPKGTFTMGSPTTEPCREPTTSLAETQHSVTLTHELEMWASETTQGEFEKVMGYNPSFYPQWGQYNPVEKVTWHAAVAYCNALSTAAGKATCYVAGGSGTACTPPDPTDPDPCPTGEACVVNKCVKYDVAPAYASSIYSCPGYRLPTDAEWEYAYRAGSTTAFYNGPVQGIGSACSPDTNAALIGWYTGNTPSGYPRKVGTRQRNAWGLADMAGNVWEWVNDWSQADLGSAAATDPAGPATGTKRIKRGGCHSSTANMLRAAQRDDANPTTREGSLGFRCVRTK